MKESNATKSVKNTYEIGEMKNENVNLIHLPQHLLHCNKNLKVSKNEHTKERKKFENRVIHENIPFRYNTNVKTKKQTLPPFSKLIKD